jgi:hypothetical protein
MVSQMPQVKGIWRDDYINDLFAHCTNGLPEAESPAPFFMGKY